MTKSNFWSGYAVALFVNSVVKMGENLWKQDGGMAAIHGGLALIFAVLSLSLYED